MILSITKFLTIVYLTIKGNAGSYYWKCLVDGGALHDKQWQDSPCFMNFESEVIQSNHFDKNYR